MNKTDLKRAIVKTFFEFIEKEYPDLIIEDNGDGGRIQIYTTSIPNADECIEFTRNGFSLCTFNWASNETKQLEDKLQTKLDSIVEDLNKVYNASKVK